MCHTLICPVKQHPFRGKCEPDNLQLDAVVVTYKLNISVRDSGIDPQSQARKLRREITSKFARDVRQALHLDAHGCEACEQYLYRIGSTDYPLLDDYFVSTYIDKHPHCDLQFILKHMISLLRTTIVTDSDYISSVEFDSIYTDLDYLHRNATVMHEFETREGCVDEFLYILSTDKLCPKIQINYTTVKEKVSGEEKKKLLSLFKDSLISDHTSCVDVCVSDYFSIMANPAMQYLYRKISLYQVVLFLALVAVGFYELI